MSTSRIDPRLLKNLPVDLRVVLAWDADQSNLDLRVQDPNGQVALHGQSTYQGGRLSANFAVATCASRLGVAIEPGIGDGGGSAIFTTLSQIGQQ